MAEVIFTSDNDTAKTLFSVPLIYLYNAYSPNSNSNTYYHLSLR